MRRRTYSVAVLFALLALATWGGARAFGSQAQLRSAATTCRSNPLAGVHDPQRLQILHACATFAGTVVKGGHQYEDGDWTVNVAPDPAYASMLNAKNRSKGGIHVEIVPIDQPGCRSGCSGARVRTPAVGQHVRVTGAHVYDRWVGWNEIHPAWKIELVSGRGAPPPPPPPPAQAVHLTAWLTGRQLGRHGVRGGHARVALRLDSRGVCWVFSRLARVARPTRAAIRWRERGKPGRTVLALGKRYRPRGCVVASPKLYSWMVEETHEFYVVVASKRHRFGAIRGRLRPAK